MKTEKLYIPKTISIGYQTRKDTYTEKLAYVIYTDDKGVLRKEASWNSWRDKKIDVDVFDNIPTSGFVLNKKVGGCGGWNPRATYVRVFDPRGFEFEISIPNLLFILQESNSIKGKGIEGEFVYSWSGADLVLLPVESRDYKTCTEYTALQSQKIGVKDLSCGYVYISKNNEKFVYMGKAQWSTVDSRTTHPNKTNHTFVQSALVISKIQYIFYNLDTKCFVNKSSLGFLSKIELDHVYPEYGNIYILMTEMPNYGIEFEYVKKTTKIHGNSEQHIRGYGFSGTDYIYVCPDYNTKTLMFKRCGTISEENISWLNNELLVMVEPVGGYHYGGRLEKIKIDSLDVYTIVNKNNGNVLYKFGIDGQHT